MKEKEVMNDWLIEHPVAMQSDAELIKIRFDSNDWIDQPDATCYFHTFPSKMTKTEKKAVRKLRKKYGLKTPRKINRWLRKSAKEWNKRSKYGK